MGRHVCIFVVSKTSAELISECDFPRARDEREARRFGVVILVADLVDRKVSQLTSRLACHVAHVIVVVDAAGIAVWSGTNRVRSVTRASLKPARLAGSTLWIGQSARVFTTKPASIIRTLIAARQDLTSRIERAYVPTLDVAKAVCVADSLRPTDAVRQRVKEIRKLLGPEAWRLESHPRCGFCWCGPVQT